MRLPFFITIHLYRFFFIQRYRKFNSLFKVTKFFQFKFAGFISLFFIFFYPLYYYLKSKNFIFFYSSISSAPGHFIPELDWLLRKKFLGEFKGKKIIIICPKSEVAIGIKIAYGDLVHRYFINDYLFRFFLPFLILYKDLSINCNISNIDNSFFFKKKQTVKLASLRQIEYFNIRNKTKNYFPLKRKLQISNELKTILSRNYKKYALIQIKSRTVNATAKSIDPKTYIKSIKYLKKRGFNIIFAGRENMPYVFKSLGLINYSKSDFQNFYNDICLVNYSKFNLTSGSGFNNLADTLNIPIVVTNSWHIGFSLFNNKSIFVPSLIKDKNYFMKFKIQSDLLLNKDNANSPVSHKFKNCNENDVLHAVRECLKMRSSFNKLNYLQIKFKKLLKDTPHYYSNSRISYKFINKYRYLI